MQTDAAIAAALTALLPRVVPGAARIGGLRRLSGGATQEIWRFDAEGSAAPVPLVLRRAPGGDRLSEQTVGLETEAALLGAAAAAGVPVPPVAYVLAPGDGLGRGFVMGFVEGETLGGRIVRSPPPDLARQCGAVLAQIHAIDPAGFPALTRLDAAALVERWRTLYRASAWPRPVFEVALRWLDAHRPPPPTRAALVHGDFRNGNLIIGPEGLRAVLDWELAYVGDGLADLGWLCVNSWRFGRVDLPVGGFGTASDLIDGYGTAVDPATLRWWEVFGTLRWGCMCAGMAAAFRAADPSVERALIARRASETELDLLRLLRD